MAAAGWVRVSTDHDTAEFVMATIRTVREKAWRAAYAGAPRLLITAGNWSGGRSALHPFRGDRNYTPYARNRNLIVLFIGRP